MNLSHTFQESTRTETLEPHMYIDTYSNASNKALFHAYKFAENTSNLEYRQAHTHLLRKTLDICLEMYLRSTAGLVIYTSPPSTMHARGEKKTDSMYALVREAAQKLIELVQKNPDLHTITHSLFSISQQFLKEKRAQHIDGNRRSRIKNLHTRYSISFTHILYIFYCIHIKKIKHFSYILIDDVSSTGATLVSCKDSILRTMSLIHRKNPHISYDVKIFSLSH